jgi:hypothetical protein
MPRESIVSGPFLRRGVFATVICLVGIACSRHRDAADSAVADHTPASVSGDTASACAPEVRAVVENFGKQLRLVSVLAPAAAARQSIADAYADIAAPDLLDAWQRDPRSAPGREVSNPWPARIEIRGFAASTDRCRVDGDVIYVTSADTVTAVERRPVSLTLARTDQWRVTAYDPTPRSAVTTTTDSIETTPVDVVRAYYTAIRSRNYAAAYRLWGRDGSASGKSEAAFAGGFKDTRSVAVTIGDSVRIEGAAGSQFATIPVTVDAELATGERQHFVGTYTLRRVMVDGAPPEDRRWHIESASLTRR